MPSERGRNREHSSTFLARGIAILRTRLDRLLEHAASLKFDFLKKQVKEAAKLLNELWDCATRRQVLDHPVILEALMALERDLEVLRLVVHSRSGLLGGLRF